MVVHNVALILSPFLLVLLGLTNPEVANAGEGSRTYADYPRYATNVSTLRPEVRADMKALGLALVGAVLGGQSVDVTVYGHADFDAKGRDFETGVSQQRADGAETTLLAFFNQAADAVALPADRRSLVRFTSIGLGTLRPVFSRPANEEQRKANRRVEVVWTTAALLPADPRAKFQRCVRVLAGASPPGPVRRMACICNKLLQLVPPVVKDYYYDYRSALLLRAGAGDLGKLTTDQMNALYRGFMLFARDSIDGVSAGSDADFARGLIDLDDAIGRGLNDFTSQALLNAGLFERTVAVDIIRKQDDANHIYSCYAGYARRDADR